MRAKFALALPSGSKPGATVPLPLIDVRVQWSARHQDNAAQHAPMREFLLRILSTLSDALVSAQWGRLDTTSDDVRERIRAASRLGSSRLSQRRPASPWVTMPVKG
jgi:hypothetical protein